MKYVGKYHSILRQEVDRILITLKDNCELLERQLGTPSESRLEHVAGLFEEVKSVRGILKKTNKKYINSLDDAALEKLITIIEDCNIKLETHISLKHAFRFVSSFATGKTDSNVGQIKYNSITDDFIVFDGTRWVPIT